MSRTKSPLFAFSVLALLLMIGLAATVLAKAQSLEVNFPYAKGIKHYAVRAIDHAGNIGPLPL